jgi:ribosomal protein S25
MLPTALNHTHHTQMKDVLKQELEESKNKRKKKKLHKHFHIQSIQFFATTLSDRIDKEIDGEECLRNRKI